MTSTPSTTPTATPSSGIIYTLHPPTWIVSIRLPIETRKEIIPLISQLRTRIPENHIVGPPFCIFYYVSGVPKGKSDVEIGFPISIKEDDPNPLFESPNESTLLPKISIYQLPELESFSFFYEGAFENLGSHYDKVFTHAYARGIPSQEFSREVYHVIDNSDPVLQQHRIEIQLIIHNWDALLRNKMAKILGENQQQLICQGSESFTLDTTVEEKFQWLVGMLQTLREHASPEQEFDIISGCAHIFPDELVTEMRNAFDSARDSGCDLLEAVDRTLEFMDQSPGWVKVPIREGDVMYTTKNPRDPAAFAKATTRQEKLQAYCFCPLIRNFLDKEIPESFCYCGAGWIRKQWEGVFQQRVKIDLVKSLPKGNDECQFAIYIPGEK